MLSGGDFGTINWSNQAIADFACELSNAGSVYRDAIGEVFRCVNELGVSENWTGKNFNTVEEAMNGVLGNFRSTANQLVNEIPTQICVIGEIQAENGGGTIGHINFGEDIDGVINEVQPTQQPADGSQRIEPTVARDVINSKLPGFCDEANNAISKYFDLMDGFPYTQYDEGIAAAQQRVGEALNNTRNFLSNFQNDIRDVAEKSIQNIELTNDEAIRIAQQLSF